LSFFARFRRHSAAESAPSQPDTADAAPRVRSRPRRVLAGAATALAGLLVFVVLSAPDGVSRLPPGTFVPGAFLRIPVEGLLGVALLLILPPRPRRIVATLLGALLGVLTVVKLIDMGFFAVLSRPVDPVLDWILVDDAVSFLTDSVGRAGAIGVVVAVIVLAIGVPVLITLSVRRLTGALVRHRTAAGRGVAALSAAWIVCALLGVQILPGIPVAADTAAALAHDKALQVPGALQDRRAFAAEAAVDAFRDTAPGDLLAGLRGKDVVFSFVESYGRAVIDNPEYSTQVDAVLDAGTSRLAAAGFAARSGYLTSPTAGGGSWLAHSTFLSGLRIDNEQRYRSLVAGDRLTLTRAFGKASWRTVGVEPGVTYAWPEGEFYGYDQVYDAHTLGYQGPKFSWATMPDQYTLAEFERLEHGKPGRSPLMAEITLVSSHTPWAPLPRIVDWADVGDGSIYGPMAQQGDSPEVVWRDNARVRAEYRRSIEYSVNSLISYVAKYGDKNLVLVFLGDHQAAPIVTGPNAGRDVPVTIVAHDPAVLDRVAGWGWQDGLRPGPQSPVWPMEAFRDKFLTAFAR
jgi:hypothetical protein